MKRIECVREVRTLLSDIWGAVGWPAAGLLLVTLATGLLESVSIAVVIPLLAAIGIGGASGTSSAVVRTVQTAIDGLGVGGSAAQIGLVVLGAVGVASLAFLGQAWFLGRLQTAYVLHWQHRLFRAVFSASWPYFTRRRGGEILNAMITEAPRVGGAFYQIGLVLTALAHGLIYGVVAASLSGITTLAVLAGGGALFLVTRPLIGRAYRIGVGLAAEDANLQSLAGEFVGGAKLLKATATEPLAVDELMVVAGRLRALTFANLFDIQRVKATFEFGSAALIAGILVASQSLLAVDPALILVILAIFIRLLPKLTGLQQGVQALTVSLPAVTTLRTIVAEAEAEAERVDAAALPENMRQGPLAFSVSDLCVRHGSTIAVEDVSLAIAPGAIVALVGGSGAGKSTLVDAMLGLVPTDKGVVRVNGHALDVLPLASLRRRVGYMGQDTILFNASIRHNILWGHGVEAETRVGGLAHDLALDPLLTRLPQGLDTAVGDRGARLSGGERQRIGLLRTLLSEPGLLILDEATSALDAYTETQVMRSIAALRGRVSVLIIAHRLSTVRWADHIHVLEGGRLVESGSWDDLVCEGTRFNRLWALQSHTGMTAAGGDE
ncbi:MAG: multidrug ABC transporter ATPase/permease [Rhodospirillaceae bacterium]|nr:MAG: multidrug ABC transporter ATPase/permease [Rhodospirillaceae bacterium]